MSAIQLEVSSAEALDLLHHTGYIMTLELHVTDNASHPVGEILPEHDNSAEPVKLTGDNAIFNYLLFK